MNYYTIRVILTIIVLIAYALSSVLVFKKQVKTIRIITIIVTFLIILCTWNIKFEYLYMKFDGAETAFKYGFPKVEILKKEINDDYAYFLFTKNGNTILRHLVKNNSGWSYETEYSGQSNLKNFNGYVTLINKVENKNIYIICVLYPEILNKNVLISDSLNSDFETIEYSEEKKVKQYAIIAKIEKNIKTGYSIIINNNEFKIY